MKTIGVAECDSTEAGQGIEQLKKVIGCHKCGGNIEVDSNFKHTLYCNLCGSAYEEIEVACIASPVISIVEIEKTSC